MAPRFLLLAIVAALSGCAAAPPAPQRATARYCEPPLQYRHDAAFDPRPDLDAALTPELTARYPRRILLIANAVGILPALQKLQQTQRAAREPVDLATEVALLKQRQAILARVAMAGSAVSSVAAELDCEGERADQMANHLANLDDRRTQRINALSIVIGALGGVGATIADNRKDQYTFGIGGGLVAAGLGLLTLAQDGYTEEFQHPRNLLADVWNERPASTDWPPGVWYFLINPAFSNQGRTSIAHNARLRWQRYQALAEPDTDPGRRTVALLFGDGGSYNAEQLALRANMLNELQSSVRLINQELLALMLELNVD